MLFEFENVSYKNILKIARLNIRKQNVTCIIGESGAGKSTLLKLLNKMIIPDQGRILYQGKLLLGEDAVNHRRKVVTLSQSPLIFPGRFLKTYKKVSYFLIVN